MEGLFSLLMFAAFFYFMMRFGCGAHMVHGHGGHARRSHNADEQASATDPVCGMAVTAAQGYAKMHEGRPYRFCSRACLDKFDLSPLSYLAGGVR